MSESRSLKNRIALQCRNMPKGRGLFGRVKAGRSQDYKKGQGVCFNLRPSPSFYYISTFGGYLMMIYPNPHLSFKTPFVFARVYMARSNLGQSLTCGNLELGQSLHMVRTICNSKARGGQTIQGGPVQFSHSVVSNCLQIEMEDKSIDVSPVLVSGPFCPSSDADNLPLPCVLKIILFPFLK